ncbi:MAG: hypothetical protein DRH12_10425 [Deltaproteobacteria bacterium]|nr:MAG: hypothetical protein DRH12_10425 [Deltaproteobacteria bacterium]
MPHKYLVLVMSFFFFLTAGSVSAAQRYVSPSGIDSMNDCSDPSKPCATFAHAIEEASAGDTVVAANGTYAGSGNFDISLQGKEITVSSENGPSSCIIDCEGKGCAFVFQDDEGPTTKVSGFTIVNGGGWPPGFGQAINCFSTSPTIENCVIKQCSGSAVVNLSSSNAKLKECIIEDNDGVTNVVSINAGNPKFVNCIIANNEGACGIHMSGGSNADITNCTIINNTDDNYGGISCNNYDSPTIVNCIIWGNTPAQISSDASSTPAVSYSDVQGGYSGEHNLDLDPKLAGSHNYHLKRGSPCIDTGICGKWISQFIYARFAPYVDYEQDARCPGLSTSGCCDIGADEYTGQAPNMPWLPLLLLDE